MQDPNAIVDQISSGLKTLSLDNLMKGNVDPQKHIEGVLNSGPGADAKARQQSWAPEASAQPSFQTELGKPTAASLTATDAGQKMNEHVLGLVQNSSGAVMGANGTQYDKNATPIQIAQAGNPAMIPTASQEALQDPLFEPSDAANAGKTLLKTGAFIGGLSSFSKSVEQNMLNKARGTATDSLSEQDVRAVLRARQSLREQGLKSNTGNK